MSKKGVGIPTLSISLFFFSFFPFFPCSADHERGWPPLVIENKIKKQRLHCTLLALNNGWGNMWYLYHTIPLTIGIHTLPLGDVIFNIDFLVPCFLPTMKKFGGGGGYVHIISCLETLTQPL